MFKECGEQLFLLSDELYTVLKKTDITVPPSLIAMPYSSIAVQISDNATIFVTESENRLQVVSVRHSGTAESLRIQFMRFEKESEIEFHKTIRDEPLFNAVEYPEQLIEDIETAFNAILYLQTHADSTTWKKGSQKKIDWSNKKSVKKATKPQCNYTIVNCHTYHFEKCIESKRTINKTFWVRGHWRKQVCGKNGEDRKLIFIKPFIKGTDLPSHRQYKLT